MKISMLVWNTMQNDARVLNEARTLARADHQIIVNALLPHADFASVERIEKNFDIHRRSRSVFARMSRSGGTEAEQGKRSQFALLRLVVSRAFTQIAMVRDVVRQRPDVVHAHDVNMLPASWLAAKLSGAKLLYDAHEVSTDREGYASFSGMVKRIERFFCHRANAMITTTDMRADHFQQAYDITRPMVLQNRPRLNQASKVQREAQNLLREKLHLQNDWPIILYQGGLQSGRGLENLISAMTDVADAYLVFIGDGRLRKGLKKQAEDLELQSRAFFLQTVPHHELYALTASADIGVQPIVNTCFNHYSTDSNKMFEYLHAALPVVASDFPEIRKVVDDMNVGILVPDNDIAALSAALKTLVADEKLRKQYSQNATSAAGKYSWESQEHALIAIYDGLKG